MMGALLLSVALLVATPADSEVCAVGRAVVADLGSDHAPPSGEVILIGRSIDPKRPTLFDICPELAKMVHAPWALVDETDAQGMAVTGIDPPKISEDARSATVTFGSFVPSRFFSSSTRLYRRHGKHWRADGAAVMNFIT